jgi:hypothetical protein
MPKQKIQKEETMKTMSELRKTRLKSQNNRQFYFTHRFFIFCHFNSKNLI